MAPQQKVFAALSAAQPTPIDPQERVEAWLHDGYVRHWCRRISLDPLNLGEFRVVYLGAESMFPPSPPLSSLPGSTLTTYKTACSRLGPAMLFEELDAGYEADVSQTTETSVDLSVGEDITLASSVSDAIWVEHDEDAAYDLDSVDGSTSEDCEETQALVGATLADSECESAESCTKAASDSEPARPAMDASPAVERLAMVDSYFAAERQALYTRARSAHSMGEYKAELVKLKELSRAEHEARQELEERL